MESIAKFKVKYIDILNYSLTAVDSSIITVTISTPTINNSRVGALSNRQVTATSTVNIIPFHRERVCAITKINNKVIQ